MPQGEPIPLPDPDKEVKKKEYPKNSEAIGEQKEYLEAKLGGGHPNKNLKTFLENNRKVTLI